MSTKPGYHVVFRLFCILPLMDRNANTATAERTHVIIEHFFRYESGKTIAYLTKRFGATHFELIEDAVQDALMKAVQVWPFKGVPDNPSAWIMTTARNKVIDNFRKESRQDDYKAAVLDETETSKQEVYTEDELKDDMLRIMFICCHPQLSPENQLILTLKILCGFGKTEIASALLKNEEAVAKAYTRGKRKLADLESRFEEPAGSALHQRLEMVLRVLYLLFNEGYNASRGDQLVRKEISMEAIRLVHILLENKHCNTPGTKALLSLMYLQAARLEAKVDENGALIPLPEQDRSLWNKDMIVKGMQYLIESAEGGKLSEYHLQASIASCHMLAEDSATTDWRAILKLYDLLLKVKPSPVVALNRVVAFYKVHGADDALSELENVAESKYMQNYYLFYSVKAELLKETGEVSRAKKELNQAILLTRNEMEKTFLFKKLQSLN